MSGFEFATSHRVLVEAGAAGRLAALCQERGVTSVMLVTDPGIRNTNLLEPVINGFSRAGLALEIFDQVSADPADSIVHSAVEQAQG
ncbi:MAG: iron-containing alcohol dehydrogenase, partial [Alcanivorax sp.]|nr:iron-containing alcohol dehydrogenase [Alcanivorax sp.]